MRRLADEDEARGDRRRDQEPPHRDQTARPVDAHGAQHPPRLPLDGFGKARLVQRGKPLGSGLYLSPRRGWTGDRPASGPW